MAFSQHGLGQGQVIADAMRSEFGESPSELEVFPEHGLHCLTVNSCREGARADHGAPVLHTLRGGYEQRSVFRIGYT